MAAAETSTLVRLQKTLHVHVSKNFFMDAFDPTADRTDACVVILRFTLTHAALAQKMTKIAIAVLASRNI